jgi:large subunit ribosomal protein L6
MSRIAKQPVEILKGVSVELKGQSISVKGPKGTLSMEINNEVKVAEENGEVLVKAASGSRFANAMAGTTRALIRNMVEGVNTGFEQKLQLVGVGYRAQAQGQKVNLTLGFSHQIRRDRHASRTTAIHPHPDRTDAAPPASGRNHRRPGP